MAQHPRSIPDPGFAGDDGSVPAELAAALDRYDADPAAGHYPALQVLQDSRLLIPVVAVLGETEVDASGLAREKNSEMAAVLMTTADGRKGLLAFTGTGPMARWDPNARPVAVTAAQAAEAALGDGAEAMVVDVAGPSLFVLQGEDLRCLAEGLQLRRLPEGWGWVRALSG